MSIVTLRRESRQCPDSAQAPPASERKWPPWGGSRRPQRLQEQVCQGPGLSHAHERSCPVGPASYFPAPSPLRIHWLRALSGHDFLPPLRKLTNVWWLDSAGAFPKPTLVCVLAAAGGPCPRKAQPHKPSASRQRLFWGPHLRHFLLPPPPLSTLLG